jgi:two-component system, sensor histidine kinase FlrB
MTSLPMSSVTEIVSPPALNAALPPEPAKESGEFGEDEQFLLRAFRSFAAAASSLENSYALLRADVTRLNRELEASHAGLAQSLEENRSMREHLDRILESLPCGVLVASPDGGISQLNPEGRRLLQCNASDGGSTQLISSLRPELRDLLSRARAQAGEHEQAIAADSRPARWLSARHATLSDTDGRAGSSVFILRDVSEAKRLEEIKDKMRRDEALAEMSAVLAHEVRNPLGSLELFAGLLAESALSQECRVWVEQIQGGLRTLAATVNNVLHFHRSPELERAPVDLGALLDWARDFFAPLARQSKIVLTAQNHLAGVSFVADRHRLEQVLSNLVLNALRAMPGGGWIMLGGRRMGDEISLTVADTGSGIPRESLEKIFEPGAGRNSPGLGLAICRRIVEQHGGRISADSRPGGGARFTLTFPLVHSNAGCSIANRKEENR